MSFETKSPELKVYLNKLAMEIYGRTVTESLRKEICVSCGEPAIEGLQDQISRNEYYISGLCWDCQATIF